jgi:hypothetical protein
MMNTRFGMSWKPLHQGQWLLLGLSQPDTPDLIGKLVLSSRRLIKPDDSLWLNTQLRRLPQGLADNNLHIRALTLPSLGDRFTRLDKGKAAITSLDKNWSDNLKKEDWQRVIADINTQENTFKRLYG